MSVDSMPFMLRQRLTQLWPVIALSFGIVLSFVWASVLIWFVVWAVGSFT
jgi:hypothetical protein